MKKKNRKKDQQRLAIAGCGADHPVHYSDSPKYNLIISNTLLSLNPLHIHYYITSDTGIYVHCTSLRGSNSNDHNHTIVHRHHL